LVKTLQHINAVKKIVFASSFFLLAWIVLSCDPLMLYEKNTSVESAGWRNTDKIGFEVGITDTVGLYNFYINIRHSTDYRFSNIFLFVDTFFPDGSQSRDTIEIVLADASGKWFGKGLGKIKENQVMLQRGLSFPMKGLYKFRIEQGMREPDLKGVEDIGIRIERM
jgi:gliding motility-associated lipoprotein GldH